MNAEPIIQAIQREAEENAAQILQAAQDRAANLHQASQERIALEKKRQSEELLSEAEALERRLLRANELNERKSLLEQKRLLMDKAYDEALLSMRAQGDEAQSALFMELLLKNASGNETLQAGEISDGFFTADFLKKANQSLEKSGKPGKLLAASERVPGICGLVLLRQGSRIYCTLEALISQIREGLETEIAQILFE